MLGLKARMAIIDNSGGLIAECVNVLRNKTTQGLGRVGAQGRCATRGDRAYQEGDDSPGRTRDPLRRQRMRPPQQQEGAAGNKSQRRRCQRAACR
ncbi:hypothetical protein Golomagni_08367, partial [Golovinomyces magnicellulatus]